MVLIYKLMKEKTCAGVGNGETTLIGACQDRVRTMNKTCDLFPCNYILSSQLAMGAVFGVEPPKQKCVQFHILIKHSDMFCNLLYVESADRPGLLVDLVKIISDINIAMEFGEFDIEGLLAKAKFHVSYMGKAIINPLQQQVLSNSLRYFLRRPTTEDASF
ncbi:hypothetical protein LINPERHAP1_LOCUS21055 [Linum perenne]